MFTYPAPAAGPGAEQDQRRPAPARPESSVPAASPVTGEATDEPPAAVAVVTDRRKVP